MRAAQLLGAAALLAGTALGVLAGPATADTPARPTSGAATGSADPSATATPDTAPPTTAGTNFVTATVVQQGVRATADASTGDYMYWAFPADTGQNVTVTATVTYPAATARHGASTWQVDVYDGLRRRQPCRSGTQTRTAAAGATDVKLVCRLRAVRSWAEPWSNDPLRGAYYVRLTVLDLPQSDLGLPVRAAMEATSSGTAGAHAVDGSVAPVVSQNAPDVRPSGGWSGTWWSPRWLWTGGGGLLAVLVAIGAHRLARGPVRLSGPYGRRPPPAQEPERYAG
ncbi:hypothetical protein GA0115240_17084 [Streptomyces sp. DvalAA-14]|uniref:hypothetical protein n=1 Tax=unclassified Streptomyces TaxID=2593676 RepID=UPI00081BBE8B|nr:MULTISPECIES: hypothetical protein [unclassified Streptomyces]SCE50173.1 hypothetical protein GA0115240_17084 [Streptomyces sp. DvalAA-14]